MSMTIKQAFEKLTMVCGAALKNPFFVQRNLHDAFADIAANIEEGGGGASSAEDVSYDNTDSGLTAENVQAAIDEIVSEMPSGMHSYSTTEHVVGKWIDGTTDVYERVVSGLNLECASVDTSYATNVDWNFDKVISGSIIDQYGQLIGGSIIYTGTPKKLTVRLTMAERVVTDIIIRYIKATS